MDINQIRYFLAIVETGGFTKAADSLLISQPSLSVSIRRLERELGVTLFERGGRRAVLTPAGQFFLGTARAIWDRYQFVLNGLRDFRSQPTLRLGILRTFRIDDFSKMIIIFREKCSNAVIEFRDGTVKDLHNWLEQGEVDLIVTELTSLEDTETSLALFQQDYLLAVPQNHPFAHRDRVSLAELDDQPFIGRNNCEIWGRAPQMFEAAGVEPRVVYLADREEWAISMIKSGLGITIMPVWQGLSDIVYVPIAEADLSRTVGLKWRAQQNSDIVKLFRVFAANYAWQGV
ncbi:LysR family transcriptional regulator [Gloeobacter violaceus]|uniref:LysR family transcriptional regulatory protein n=1 Tax=Gloeobacter violaceus (strain ATCC 29082 / PCC 7421) TaxID=251221 RepID=Q7ND09_GLOVI|nr:LysR family transcriptional regulator [Gloeobacter violaceus]BAC92368.1 LysR family transcriptional regulatory protein [Gloeobacter violaceus PCC 7421]